MSDFQLKLNRLGATLVNGGVHFAVFSSGANRVDLCLFDSLTSKAETERIKMERGIDDVWRAFVPGICAGQLYAYRAQGPYDPHRGLRYDYSKILLDPYAKAVPRSPTWHESLKSYSSIQGDLEYRELDSAAFAALGAVIEEDFEWEGDSLPKIPLEQTVIYEAHVKGLSYLNPKVPEEHRGKYLGLSSNAIIEHLKELGITTVKVLPIHSKFSEYLLIQRKLVNYWGYNTLCFFSPEAEYSSQKNYDSPVVEFKQMVKTLHKAGIEIILDVVFNHTTEGNHFGPTLSLKGLDNAAYYRLNKENPRFYDNYTGCGNTLRSYYPRALQLIMDCLRYWIKEMHVDGFRFDLAAALGRDRRDFDEYSPFFSAIAQDPFISQVKLIAEPWDIGPGGYQVGNFPRNWSLWNDKYRDAIRRIWLWGNGKESEFVTRVSGSSDVFHHSPLESINYITSHDGFTLNDLVSYNQKHNFPNGENNADGPNCNHSNNHGVEGPAKNKKVINLRDKQRRNLVATLMFSQGVPMLLAGDELSRTQSGNNNAYCQDNEISWLNWSLTPRKKKFLEFVSKTISLRRELGIFSRVNFFSGQMVNEIKDIFWVRPDGMEFRREDWNKEYPMGFGTLIKGGEDITRFYYLCFNFSLDPIFFNLPLMRQKTYKLIHTTSEVGAFESDVVWPYNVEERSIFLFEEQVERD